MVEIKDKRELAKGYLKVPTAILGVFIFMSAQTFGAVWWASSISTKMDFVQSTQRELKKIAEINSNTRYTAEDAMADREYINMRVLNLENHYRELEHKVTTFQSKHETALGALINKRR